MSIQNLEQDILKIWGHHTEFSAKGNRYVAFVLQKQIDEMISAGFTDEVMDKELADMALVILRHWSRRGVSSEEKIRVRLAKRHEGNTDQIKDKYLKLYENYKFPQEHIRATSELVKKWRDLRSYVINQFCDELDLALDVGMEDRGEEVK